MYQQSTNFWGKDPMKWWIGQVTDPPLHCISSYKVRIFWYHLINRHILDTLVHLDVDHRIFLEHWGRGGLPP